jgi:DNA recombination protein RmuC
LSEIQLWFAGLAALSALNLVLAIAMLVRRRDGALALLGTQLREELRLAREEAATRERSLREELGNAQHRTAEQIGAAVARLGSGQKESLDAVAGTLHATQQGLRADQAAAREALEQRLVQFQGTVDARLEAVRGLLEAKFAEIRTSNEQKLEEMRKTVDEKLQGTLEKRLGESFNLVSERLEAVQRGLGEMKNLADGVGDLKRVLTNVKERGTWGEYQLAAILEQVLTPEQYLPNARPKDGGEVVEFAIRLPGRSNDPDARPVLLPIDSKFPKEDYERLLAASEAADAEGVRVATAALAAALRKSAKDIHDKYIAPPATTDFAILFLPTEGLYAEVLRQPGLPDELQTKYRVLVAGPTTLAALLNSLRVGFRTLAIEQRSHEVWSVLGAVKQEFGKFGAVLERLKKQLNTASNTIESAEQRTRAMNRKLKAVETLPEAEATALLGILSTGTTEDADEPEDAEESP